MFRSDGLVIRDIESQRCFGDSLRFSCNHKALKELEPLAYPATQVLGVSRELKIDCCNRRRFKRKSEVLLNGCR
jgi:hypothetical protein